MKNILIGILLLLSGIVFGQTSTSPGNQTFFLSSIADTNTLIGVRGRDALFVSSTNKFYKRTSYWALQATISTGSGTVSSVSVVSANGLAGTVATATTTPAITLSTSISGILKGNGTAISAATPSTDYTIPSDLTIYAPLASPTFTGTVTIPTSFKIGSTTVTTTGTQLNYLNAATGTTGTTNTNLVYSASPTFTGTINAANTVLTTAVSTGTGATAGLNVTANSLTTGNGMDISTSSLTTGMLQLLSSTSTALSSTTACVSKIMMSGTNANSSVTATGQQISVTNTGTTSTNIGLDVSASGATNNYPIRATGGIGAGGLILGGKSATYGSIWSTNVTPSSSNYSFISDGANSYLNGSGSVSLQIAGVAKLSMLAASTTISNTIIHNSGVSSGTGVLAGQQLNYNSLTTGNGIEASTSSLTTGTLASFASTSTALSGSSGTLLKLTSSGTNANSAVTVTGATIAVTNTNATSGTNVALTLSASGATTANTALQIAYGDVLWGIDNTYDIGAQNTKRARRIYAGSQMITPFITVGVPGSGFGLNCTATSLAAGSNNFTALSANQTLGFASANDASYASMDINISRISAGLMGIGTGVRGSVAGNLAVNAVSIGSSASPVSKLYIPVAPTASSNYGTVSIGSGAWDGSTSGKYVGTSSSGTSLAINEISGYGGNLFEAEVAGVSKARIQNTGVLVIAGYLTTPGGQGINFQSRGWVQAPSDGVFEFQNDGQTSFGRLQLGGTSSSFPAIKRSSATLAFRLADDSADCDISAAKITASAPVVLKGYTVSTLPAGTVGMLVYCTDLTTPTFGATAVGGGAVVGLLFYDGVNWTCR